MFKNYKCKNCKSAFGDYERYRVYCSKKCQHEVAKSVDNRMLLACKYCDKEFKEYRNDAKFCSQKCYGLSKTKERPAYSTIHIWIKKIAGQPHDCEFCGNTKLRDRQYEWANRSGSYLRQLSDWLRLCSKCHRAYDRSGHMETLLLK